MRREHKGVGVSRLSDVLSGIKFIFVNSYPLRISGSPHFFVKGTLKITKFSKIRSPQNHEGVQGFPSENFGGEDKILPSHFGKSVGGIDMPIFGVGEG